MICKNLVLVKSKYEINFLWGRRRATQEPNFPMAITIPILKAVAMRMAMSTRCCTCGMFGKWFSRFARLTQPHAPHSYVALHNNRREQRTAPPSLAVGRGAKPELAFGAAQGPRPVCTAHAKTGAGRALALCNYGRLPAPW